MRTRDAGAADAAVRAFICLALVVGSDIAAAKTSSTPLVAGHVFDVRSYGALGDGVADDLPAFDRTVAAARAAGGGTIYLPRPAVAYRLTGTWVVGAPRFLDETDIKYVSADWEWTSAPSYRASNRSANAAEPLYSVIAEPGAIVWGDFTSPARRAVVYYTALGDVHQNHRSKVSARFEGLTIAGREAFTRNPTRLARLDYAKPLAASNRQVGLAYVGSPLHVAHVVFQELDVGLLTCDPFWTTIRDSRAHHVNVGFSGNRLNAVNLANLAVFHAYQWGFILSGEQFTVTGIHTEEARQDVWVPWANMLVWNGGYLENTQRENKRYAVVFGDASNATDHFQVLNTTVTGLKIGRRGGHPLSFHATRAKIARSSLKDAASESRSIILDTHSHVLFEDTEPTYPEWESGGHPERATFVYSQPGFKPLPSAPLWVAGDEVGGTWSSFTPSWTSDAAPGPTIGDGELVGRYRRMGQIVFVQINFKAGEKTSFGTGGWRFELPVPAADGLDGSASAYARDETADKSYVGAARIEAHGTALRVLFNESDRHGAAATVPFRWVPRAKLTVNGWYFARDAARSP